MVRLRTFDDKTSDAENGRYEAGLVSIWRVPAKDVDASGTTVVLTNLQKHTVRTLSDADRWFRAQNGDPGGAPRFHVGHATNSSLMAENGQPVESLPWNETDDGAAAFKSLVDAVWEELLTGGSRNPSIHHMFDKYLQTVWELALAAPLPYVGTHPLLASSEDADRFMFQRDKRKPAVPLTQGSLASALKVDSNVGTGTDEFRVFVDNLELRRPIRVEHLPRTSHALTKPLIFADRVREEFGGVEAARSGGPLEFVAYVMWAPKIAPIEHNGSLIRVHGASGTLFDGTFLQYGIAENTRLRQLTCEIFVMEGFEGALNIDREGFNQAHPHARRLAGWLHAAIGRAINTEKNLANKVRRESRATTTAEHTEELERLARRTWQQRQNDSGDPPPVEWSRPTASHRASVDTIRLQPERILGQRRDSAAFNRERQTLATIAQILAAYNFLDNLSTREINELLGTLAEVLRAER